eukprot:GHVU01072403.1.p1 GENE.GHVU01072403.1~~GHVU01072403.1.p1  ORF type:complete len:125 (-),score=21.52 GHVU01072403.1:409-783(-)
MRVQTEESQANSERPPAHYSSSAIHSSSIPSLHLSISPVPPRPSLLPAASHCLPSPTRAEHSARILHVARLRRLELGEAPVDFVVAGLRQQPLVQPPGPVRLADLHLHVYVCLPYLNQQQQQQQ